MAQILTLLLVLLLAVAVLVGSIVYHVREVRAEEEAWDALIDRVRQGREP